MLTNVFLECFFWLHTFLQNNIETYVYLEEMMTNSNEKTENKRDNYVCEYCDFTCSYKSDYIRHCSTRKHKMMTMDDPNKNNGEPTHICSHCKKIYKTKQSLWVHKQKCKAPEKENISMVIQNAPQHNLRLCKVGTFGPRPSSKAGLHVLLHDDTAQPPLHNIIMELLEQNKEFKQTIMEQSNKMMVQSDKMLELAQNQNNTTINNNKNITNNQFNLNVFLQQTCKDALNMSDFIDSLEIDTKSLERTGTHGYVHGISKIFMDGLRKLKVQDRPIHCTDLKREVLYIKDNDTWTKDTEDNKQFKKALATVVHRNMIQIVKWEEENPETSNPESKTYEFYFEVVRQSLGGGDQDVTDRNNDKILKAIAKEVHIDKKVKELL